MRATKQRRDAMHALDLTASRVKPAAVLNISKRFRIVPSPLNPCLRTTRPSSAKRNTNADRQPRPTTMTTTMTTTTALLLAIEPLLAALAIALIAL